jgi:hypothetical protein
MKPNLREEGLYDLLLKYGISDTTVQILKSEEIRNMSELKQLKDEVMKKFRVKLGEIIRLRKI